MRRDTSDAASAVPEFVCRPSKGREAGLFMPLQQQIRRRDSIVDINNHWIILNRIEARGKVGPKRERAMNVMQPQRNSADEGTGYDRRPTAHNAALTEVGRGTPMGELLRRYLAPSRPVVTCHQHAARGACSGRRSRAVSRWRRPSGVCSRAMLPSRHNALLRQGRGSRHPLLLSWLAV